MPFSDFVHLQEGSSSAAPALPRPDRLDEAIEIP
jgi:hypothetical protein